MTETKELTTNIEEQIKEITKGSLTVSLPPNVLSRLTQKATFIGLSVEELVEGVILDSVSNDVGSAVITGPSSAKHKKISGPSWATNGELS